MPKIVNLKTASVLASKIVSMQIDPFLSRRILVRLTQDKQALAVNFDDDKTATQWLKDATSSWENALSS